MPPRLFKSSPIWLQCCGAPKSESARGPTISFHKLRITFLAYLRITSGCVPIIWNSQLLRWLRPPHRKTIAANDSVTRLGNCLKILATKFLTKEALMFGDFTMGYFEKHHFLFKKSCVYFFRSFWKHLGYF